MDNSRKHYTDYNFKDWMRATPSKSIWNSILSQSVGYGEFTKSRARKTSLSASILAYLKQSESKKPYMDRDFNSMEEIWEGPPGGGFTPRDIVWPSYDHPWVMQAPPTWLVVFDINSDSCFCAGEEKSLIVTGTHPIYEIRIGGERTEGSTITVIEGYGTNEVTGTVTAGEDKTGTIIIEGYMVTSEGQSGHSNTILFECRNCDDCAEAPELTEGTYPTTIIQSTSVGISVVGGVAPYSWSLGSGGTGFSFGDNETDVVTNTLIASGSACGSAIITVTDDCEQEVTFAVRCTTGHWHTKASGVTACYAPGPSTESSGKYRVAGYQRQYQNYQRNTQCDFGSSTFCLCKSSAPGPCEQTVGWATVYPECVGFDCTKLAGVSFGGTAFCCEWTGPGESHCRDYYTQSLVYYEWDCV